MNRPTGNPLFDYWLEGQSEMLRMQGDWWRQRRLPETQKPEPEAAGVGGEHWDRCRELFQGWQDSWEQWFSALNHRSAEEQQAGTALAFMVDPQHFMKFGSDTLSLMFNRLASGPEFADMGLVEKQTLKTGREWQAFQSACQRYHEILAQAWQRAWQAFADDFAAGLEEDTPSQEWLERWLQTADRELVATLRSSEFLEAQRQLFTAGTDWKQRQDGQMEQWAEQFGFPTRSEVDDLHTLVYELRREVRSLRRELTSVQASAAPAPTRGSGKSTTGSGKSSDSTRSTRSRSRVSGKAGSKSTGSGNSPESADKPKGTQRSRS